MTTDATPDPSSDLDAVRLELRRSAESARRKLHELEDELFEANLRLRAAGVPPVQEPFILDPSRVERPPPAREPPRGTDERAS